MAPIDRGPWDFCCSKNSEYPSRGQSLKNLFRKSIGIMSQIHADASRTRELGNCHCWTIFLRIILSVDIFLSQFDYPWLHQVTLFLKQSLHYTSAITSWWWQKHSKSLAIFCRRDLPDREILSRDRFARRGLSEALTHFSLYTHFEN